MKQVYKECRLLVDYMLAKDPDDEAAYRCTQVITGFEPTII